MIWTASAVASQIVTPDDIRDHGPDLETLTRVYGVRDGVRRRVGRWRHQPPVTVADHVAIDEALGRRAG